MMTLLLRMPAEISLLKQFIRKLEIELTQWIETMARDVVPSEHHPAIERGMVDLRDSMLPRNVSQVLRVNVA
ncbi:hypothetical protein [Rhizobium sp. BE258]|uniref:hypothetical protein n=1 Tax=Rhizobium sp. BE258 TaxID=2817722 RepID=UPI00286266D4|nr:hypothetical protein [Rhizobium sp. BE258]MDR7141836.1 hypothetical protein [Rhizobium sp. BE258]